MIVADSDVLIDFLRGAEPIASLVSEFISRGTLATTVVNQFELESGARSARERNAVDALLGGLQVVPLDPRSATRAAETRRSLESAGEPIGMADYLIAGVCLAQDLRLLTRNVRHFGRVPGLVLVPFE